MGQEKLSAVTLTEQGHCLYLDCVPFGWANKDFGDGVILQF